MSDEQRAPQVTLNEITESLEIEYPARWLYKVIGEDETAVREAVLELIDLPDVSLELSNTSSSGRYVSINVEVVVQDQEQRVEIYEALRRHVAVRMVL